MRQSRFGIIGRAVLPGEVAERARRDGKGHGHHDRKPAAHLAATLIMWGGSSPRE